MYVAMKAVRLIIKREFVFKTFIGNNWQLFQCCFYFLLFLMDVLNLNVLLHLGFLHLLQYQTRNLTSTS